MATTISIIAILACTIVLVLVYLCSGESSEPQRIEAISYSDTAKWCLRNDPNIARVVLSLAYLEKHNGKSHIRRKKSFLVLELMNRVKLHVEDRQELKSVCYELVHMAINISKSQDEQSDVN